MEDTASRAGNLHEVVELSCVSTVFPLEKLRTSLIAFKSTLQHQVKFESPVFIFLRVKSNSASL